jgi:hypothetical protein
MVELLTDKDELIIDELCIMQELTKHYTNLNKNIEGFLNSQELALTTRLEGIKTQVTEEQLAKLKKILSMDKLERYS